MQKEYFSNLEDMLEEIRNYSKITFCPVISADYTKLATVSFKVGEKEFCITAADIRKSTMASILSTKLGRENLAKSLSYNAEKDFD
jgi:hypothetical protein